MVSINSAIRSLTYDCQTPFWQPLFELNVHQGTGDVQMMDLDLITRVPSGAIINPIGLEMHSPNSGEWEINLSEVGLLSSGDRSSNRGGENHSLR